ncbi:MAG: MnhB domain-containing protein [Actinomycetota bacterium]
MTSVVLRSLATFLTPVIGLFSVYLLLRGHDAPGGGFIAGLAASAAVILQYMARGPGAARRILPVRFEVLLGFGLGIALLFGLGGLVFGDSFLQGAIWKWQTPLLGELKIAASLIFDVGVFLVVLAMAAAIVSYLGGEEE